MNTKTLLIVIFIFSLNLNLKASPVEPEKYVICKNKKIVRTIRIEKGGPKACETKYTKAGVDRVVGSGISITGCDNILNNVMGNLQEANWKCRVVKDVKISKLVSDSSDD